ncbi:PhoH family protein [Pseudoalteromonas sp. McH1-7]|uniref:PhoH-like ATPase n=1 Tax=Pseudoalteromonas peptidolytica F12-50-A1 TaxID=1315280 RepID=A0A8I0MT88_9GAMM|nr:MULTISPECIES: PhoH family protein [Pseudoalteromonas]MBE0345395.1 PhoH-like ATPase [Pseudoalteromonas peptidolytica F12-50-A1]MDW7547506.1 PhoH family protein [Pseudoalteromonas peptidolytica]NLR13346.1 PhoH family protein [Pseudoalteromonas peptidolytica]NUZ09812.1 PhoH family protein [Pseudoalteromonas sp. McH1-7]RRS09472.1 PhoH family protein [Pseudoalteromonas sp. J010]
MVKQDKDHKVYVLDTNVLLHEPLAYLSFQEHDVVVPMTVLEELDHIKDRKSDVSRDARVAIRGLDDVLRDATPEQMLEGVALPTLKLENHRTPSSGKLIIVNDHLFPDSISGLPGNENDHRIINCAVHLQTQYSDKKVLLVTKDINMRLKAKGAGLKYVEDYRTDQLIDDIALLTSGFKKVDGDFWQDVGECQTQQNGRYTIHEVPKSLVPDVFCNEYLIDDTNHFAARVVGYDDEHIRLKDLGVERLMHRQAWGVKPKNINQGMALDALLDTDIELVILTGPAGCGKTLLALASALEMIIEKGIYDKVIVTRNTPEIAESIGFLPGTEEEKMAPWLAAITDTLEVLHKHDESPVTSRNYIMEKANIQFKSVNFMRGRSIQNAVVILDESQNLTASQLKTIITRCGEGTKLICTGNLAQIDSNYLTPVTSGLTYIVERFKDFEGSATINLNGVVRSRLASFAEENL